MLTSCPQECSEPITQPEVASLHNSWKDYFATLDPSKVAEYFSTNSALLNAVSDMPRTEHPRIFDYFANFLKLNPQGEILLGKSQ